MAKRVGKARQGPSRDQMPSTDLTSQAAMLAASPYGTPVITVTYGNSSRGITLNTPADWFGPQDPMRPSAPPEVAGRAWDYPSGYNLNIRPRSYEPIGFHDLRNLAETYDVLRLVIETRKDQMERLNWTIRPRDESKSADGDPRCAVIEQFFQRPDGENDFPTWLRIVLEDLFVLDAPALYCQRNRDGSLRALQPIDGSTIKRVIDDWGRTPQPYAGPDGQIIVPPAYQQNLKGLPAVNYSARDLIYRPRNKRAHKVYGFSPVEQIIMTVNIGLRRQISTLQSYTEGNIPEAFLAVPETWTAIQIKAFQDYWDAMMEGNTAQKRHAKFVPGGIAYTPTKEPELKNLFDEWLARIVCFSFSISPQPFVIQMNRATAQTAQEAALEEGLEPTMLWAKALFDYIIRVEMNAPDLEFAYVEDKEIDQTAQTALLVNRVSNGIQTIDEARSELGMDGFGIAGVTDVPMVKTTMGFKVLDEEGVSNTPPPTTMPAMVGPDGKPLAPTPGKPFAPAGGKGAGEDETPPPAGKALMGHVHKRARQLKPISVDRPAAAEARKRYQAKAADILARAFKSVSEQLPDELKQDASRRHEA